MPRYLALLRGINLGGRNKVAMADLRALAGSLGHSDVSTYIQSGNLLFTSPQADPGALAAELATQVGAQLGVRSPVLVISAADLAQVVAGNPFGDPPDRRMLHAVFLPAPPEPDRVAAIAAEVERVRAKGSKDDAIPVGRALYLSTPDGFGNSELASRLTRPGAAGTARNWATVLKLADLLSS